MAKTDKIKKAINKLSAIADKLRLKDDANEILRSMDRVKEQHAWADSIPAPALEASTREQLQQIDTKINVKHLERLIPQSQVYKTDGSLKDDEGQILKKIDTWHIGNDLYFDSDDGIVFKKQKDGNAIEFFQIPKTNLPKIIRYCEMRQSVLQYHMKQQQNG